MQLPQARLFSGLGTLSFFTPLIYLFDPQTYRLGVHNTSSDLSGLFGVPTGFDSDAEVTVLYGSETGNAEEQAKNLMQEPTFRGGFRHR